MKLDTGLVFKKPVVCLACKEEYLFTLRAIAESPELKCGCGNAIDMHNAVYARLVREVREALNSLL